MLSFLSIIYSICGICVRIYEYIGVYICMYVCVCIYTHTQKYLLHWRFSKAHLWFHQIPAVPFHLSPRRTETVSSKVGTRPEQNTWTAALAQREAFLPLSTVGGNEWKLLFTTKDQITAHWVECQESSKRIALFVALPQASSLHSPSQAHTQTWSSGHSLILWAGPTVSLHLLPDPSLLLFKGCVPAPDPFHCFRLGALQHVPYKVPLFLSCGLC